MTHGIILVDHGSRRAQSNQLLEEVADLFAKRFNQLYEIVEPAHMELAEPSIATAFDRCVKRGAMHVIVCPFFLGPGKHWTSDIPRLTLDAAAAHPGTSYHVSKPIGVDDLILDLLNKRIQTCFSNNFRCESCQGTIRSGEPGITLSESDHGHGHSAASANGICSTCPFVVNADGTITDKRKVPA